MSLRAGMGAWQARAEAAEALVKDYEQMHEDHKRLVRELDVLLHGEAGAAKQASLCDLVKSVELMKNQKPVARLLYWTGASVLGGRRTIARTYKELPKGTHSEAWEEGKELYTKD